MTHVESILAVTPKSAEVAKKLLEPHRWTLGTATIYNLIVQTIFCPRCLAIITVGKDLTTAVRWLDAVTGHVHTRPAEPEGTPGI